MRSRGRWTGLGGGLISPFWKGKHMKFRKCSRYSRAAAAAALAMMTMAISQARAEVPRLPDSAVGSEAFAVISVSADKVTPENLEAASKAVLGANAGMAQK